MITNKSTKLRFAYILLCISLLLTPFIFKNHGIYGAAVYLVIGLMSGFLEKYANRQFPVVGGSKKVLDILSLGLVVLVAVLAIAAKIVERKLFSQIDRSFADDIFLLPLVAIVIAYAVYTEVRITISRHAI